MVAIMLVATFGFSTAYASGIEDFPLNKTHDVGSFTFKDGNTTPTKTVAGRYLWTYFDMTRASTDQGIASTPILVTVEVLDASTMERLGGKRYLIDPGKSISGGFETDLGYGGRKICYRFDASSVNGPTNGYFRSVKVKEFKVNSSFNQGTYWET